MLFHCIGLTFSSSDLKKKQSSNINLPFLTATFRGEISKQISGP
jgi:hypothetical protein